MAVGVALGDPADADAVCTALASLQAGGLAPAAVAAALVATADALAAVEQPELVWSGPQVPGVHARDTRRVFEEIVSRAQRQIWVSAYTYYDGPKAFRLLAERMDTVQALQVTLLLNIGRRRDDPSPPADVVVRFAKRFWEREWPGQRRPTVFYDKRSLDPDGATGVLHAKALVADDAAAFITSANLTEAAFDRNLELGVLSRDRTLASSLARHFRALIETQHLSPLPQ
jgi:phosphatidylserine/phosphatidylglycerophosphate/cardiolipin synthase-like enzyme